ncbi:TonB-dependent receptor plug domain-containing protein [Marilutibacter chinensis]|uniref:TonB-dependent receptor n=1 Tax=Marilutibacter chinensis TaxID=2912247 RepID=A0ABS9HYI1_9GAMM|nr:TonB-dependent receptor [Lysobacter chinensis]MCF7223234.1 TonB-dependent receptor [Lysobacter chinensis]
MNHLRSAVRVGLLPASIALALTPVIAGAQEAETGSEATTLDRIEVTGSRIRGADMETQQPIITIGREEIELQGKTSVADILQNLTSAGSPAISRASALSSGEAVGGYYIDLRNLGAQRTLILVNGKRLGATTSGYQDLSQIPTSAIDRIEILKDGASAIYGSDAIAGVVNVITRKRFDGAEAEARIGQYSEGDGEVQQYSFTIGSAGDRGGVTLSVQYDKEEPVLSTDRWFAKDGSAGPDYPGAGWSPITHRGSFCDPCVPTQDAVWWTLNDGGDPTNRADYHPITPAEYTNANQQMLVQTGIERKSVFANANYDISDKIFFNADVLYNHRSTDQLIAGYPYGSDRFGTPLSGDSVFNPTPGTDVQFRRRLWEVPRTTKSDLETYRFAGGFNGYFELAGKPWDWDVGALLNTNRVTKVGHGDANLFAAADALGPSFINADGIAQCGSAANPIGLDVCRPWNPLLPYGVDGQGSLADPALQALMFPYYTDTGETKTTSYTANLTGSLFELPAGEVGLAVGYEHRKESGRFVPDAFRQTGNSTGLAASTTEGEYDLDEFYAELNIPVLADMALAKELTFNVASRYSDYSNFGDTTNSKFGFTWRPVDDLLVRGTWAEGFRAPTIDDLYGGIGSSFEDYIDPCGVGARNSVNGNAACNAAGVPIGYVQLGQGLVPCTQYPCQTPDQFITGSNANLVPETSESQTVGLVWSPRWVEGLDISLDWYKYELENMIIEDSVDRILRDCYVLGNASRCEGIERAADGHITNMFFGLANLGSMETEGYDLGVKYRLPEFSFGQFVIDWQSTYVSRYDEEGQNRNGDSITVGRVGEPGFFRLRSNIGVDYSFGDFTVSYLARYYSGMKEGCIPNRPCTDPDRYANGEPDAVRRVGSNTFHDVQFSWKAPWNATIGIGASNVFDHRGPVMFSQPSSNFAYYGGFDIGRMMYVRYQQRF